MDEDDVRTELARRLRREPDETIWQDLEAMHYVSMVIEDSAVQGDATRSFSDLVDRYREVERRFGRGRSAAIGASRRPREIPIGELEETLAELAQTETARLLYLAHFRARLGGLIAPEEIAAWIETKAAAALSRGGATVWIEVPVEVPEGGLPRADALLSHIESEVQRMRAAPSWRLGRWRTEALSYPQPDGSISRLPIPRIVPGPDESPSDALRAWQELVALKQLAGELTRDFSGWTEDQAVVFVLSGRAPVPPRGSWTIRRNSLLPALGTVELRLSPLAEPREVVALFRSARAELLGAEQRVRTPTNLAIALGRFADRANTGITWAEAMKQWNAQAAGNKQYRDWRVFARDVRRAYEQVTGGLVLGWGDRDDVHREEDTHV